MEPRKVALVCCVLVLQSALVGLVAARADDPEPLTSIQAFDPGAGVTALGQAARNESDPTPPFMGLASDLVVDPLFGTATTSIPIPLPPGRKGMTPNLNVRYSSNFSNGIFGMGWHLELGSIKRNTAKGVPLDYTQTDYTYSDANGFVLTFADGTPILLDSCLNVGCTSWAASAEEAWVSATLNRTANTWEVIGRDGMTYTYGNNANAKSGFNISAPSGTFAWALTEARDPSGNRISVVYKTTNSGSFNHRSYPERIDYGSNLNVSVYADIFHIVLTYEDRPDKTTSHRGGFEDKLSFRVASVAVSVDGEANSLRTYRFSYAAAPRTGLSLLDHVTLELVGGTQSPPATVFTYESGATGFRDQRQDWSLYQSESLAGLYHDFIDIDADGLPDRVWAPVVPLKWARNLGGYFGPAQSTHGQFPYVHYTIDWGDVNADGRIDAIAWGNGLFFVNTPDGFVPESYDWVSVGPVHQESYIDADGDGRTDWFYRYNDQYFWSRLVAGGYLTYSPWDNASTFPIADLNGDGLPDQVVPTDQYWDIYFNTGKGFSPTAAHWNPPRRGTAIAPVAAYSGTSLQAGLIDMNGDGLPDYVDAAPSPWKVWLNNGSGFVGPFDWANSPAETVLNRGSSLMRDVNGDGLSDHAWSASFLAGDGARPAMMRSISNGLGAVTSIEYAAAINRDYSGAACVGGSNANAPCATNSECNGGSCQDGALVSHAAFPIWVVRRTSVTSGFSGDGNVLTTDWAFTDPYFDPATRQFRGFRQSEATRVADGRTTRRMFAPPPVNQATTWYTNTDPYPFKLVGEEVRDSGGTLLNRTRIDWAVVDLGGGRKQLHPSQRESTQYGGDPAGNLTLQREYAYDAYNNITEEQVSGTDIPTTVTTAVYAAPVPCRSQPTSVITTEGSTTLADRSFVYDARCNVTSIAANASGMSSATTTVEYDQSASSSDQNAGKAGQPTKLIDPLSNATKLSYACSAGLYPCTITNALNQSRYKEWDRRWGKEKTVSELTLPDIKTRFTYDAMGRLLYIYRTGDSTPWRAFSYLYGFPDGNNPPNPSTVLASMREPNSAFNLRSEVAYFDSLGRRLQTGRQRYVDNVATYVAEDRVAFDEVGRVKTRYVPFAIATNVLAPVPATTRATSFEYDSQDRVLKTTNPNGTYRTTAYESARKRLLSDENALDVFPETEGSVVVEHLDALGRVRAMQTYRGLQQIEVSRSETTYDGLGRVVSTTVVDAATSLSATTTMEFDGLGRLFSMTDPDSGQWTYKYDLAGNLIYQDDPVTGQHIELCYDKLNRLFRKLYPLGDTISNRDDCLPNTTPTIRYVQFTYGSSGNAAGRLAQAAETAPDFSYANTYVYDDRGRMLQETTTRKLGSSPERTGNLSYTYDAADRLWMVNYPTGGNAEVMVYRYNDLGQLRSVASNVQAYATDISYDLLGRMTRWSDGSGLVHAIERDTTGVNNFRISDIYTYNLDVQAGQNPYPQWLNYPTYDSSGNLTTIDDYSDYPQGEVPNSWSYAYDGVGRLTVVFGPWLGNFDYDGLGNMTIGHGQSFEYTNVNKPHHNTNLSGYNSNGAKTSVAAMGTVPQRTMTYDADSRLKTISTSTGSVKSFYNFRGERIGRIVDEGLPTQKTTYYYDKLFEVTGTTLTRHLYMGHMRIGHSPVLATSGLALAALSPRERAIQIASSGVRGVEVGHMILPSVALGRVAAATTASAFVIVFLVLAFAPGQVRIGYLGRVRRGRAAWLIVIWVAASSPLPLVRPAQASSGPGPTPSGAAMTPVYFIHSDHLGSTTMLTCWKVGSNCPDRNVTRYFRYDAYGIPYAKLWAGTEANLNLALPAAQNGTTYTADRLYTGQQWDDRGQTYYYGARHYDPQAAVFLTTDPFREFASPYSYVGWNPILRSDPTGMLTSLDAGGASGLNYVEGFNISGGVWSSLRDQVDAGLVGRGGSGSRGAPAWVPEWYLPFWLARDAFRNGEGFTATQGISSALADTVSTNLSAQLQQIQQLAERAGGGMMSTVTGITFVGGVGFSASTPFLGVEGALGAFLNPGLGDNEFSVGGFGSVAMSTGLNVSVDGFVGGIQGPIDGLTINSTGTYGLVGVTAIHDTSGNFLGFTLGFGPSATGYGFSTAATFTGAGALVGNLPK